MDEPCLRIALVNFPSVRVVNTHEFLQLILAQIRIVSGRFELSCLYLVILIRLLALAGFPLRVQNITIVTGPAILGHQL